MFTGGSQANPTFGSPIEEVQRELGVLFNHKGVGKEEISLYPCRFFWLA